MRFEITNGEIIVGRSVGSEIASVIEHASKSIRIVSQQISPRYAQLLRKKNDQGVTVELITTENIDSGCYPYLVTRIEHVDETGRSARKNDGIIALICLLIGLALIFAQPPYIPHPFLLGISALIASFVFFKKRNNRRLRYYTYSPNFPFRVMCVAYKNGQPTNTSKFFVNGKLYIVDDSIAYLGSGNLTEAGVSMNYESFVKLSNGEQIQALSKEFEILFNHGELWHQQTESIGQLVYDTR